MRLKTQQRVELRYAHTEEKPKGTVSRVRWNGDFRVSFDSSRDDRGRKVSGGRFWYRAAQATAFTVLS